MERESHRRARDGRGDLGEEDRVVRELAVVLQLLAALLEVER
jgi:hypothetical protein